MAARWAHNPKVGGSSPPSATKTDKSRDLSVFFFLFFYFCIFAKILFIDKMRHVYIFLISLLIPFLCVAKSGQEHINDMIDVYPFKVNKGDRIYHFFECVNAAIDYGEFNPQQQIKTPKKPTFLKQPPFQNTTWANHRIWYHWGFNANVRLFAPLTALVEKNIANGSMRKEDTELFYSNLYKEIGKRNNELMRQAASVLGYPANGWSSAMRDQINAFVSIPYAVHLLGDRFEQYTTTSVMQPMEDIIKSVYRAIDNLAGKELENIQNAKRIKNELARSTDTPEEFLNAMKRLIPEYMLSLRGGIYDINKKCQQLSYNIK